MKHKICHTFGKYPLNGIKSHSSIWLLQPILTAPLLTLMKFFMNYIKVLTPFVIAPDTPAKYIWTTIAAKVEEGVTEIQAATL